MTELVGELFDGPIDIVGDVHGEYDALVRLLKLLGYDSDGTHELGHRLVFLGDLVDRGHDSPAVLEFVMRLVDTGRAQCILGNHELNILSGRYGHGNGWLLSPPAGVEAETYRSMPASPERRRAYLDFLESLPVALENRSLRVVHACWDDEAVDALHGVQQRVDLAKPGTVSSIHDEFEVASLALVDHDELLQAALTVERLQFDMGVKVSDWDPIPLPAHSAAELAVQHANPMTVLTAGLARSATLPYFGAGRWRFTERTPWWNSYRGSAPVVIGHFWREFGALEGERFGVFGQDVLAGVASHDWMGLCRNVYCVDYSVGKRHLSRSSAQSNDGKLAAIRFPEWEVVHDDGTVVSIGPPGIDGLHTKV